MDDSVVLPQDVAARKAVPLARGLVDYFPAALAAVAALSAKANAQHHAGQPLHWDRSKSTDADDALLRHFFDRGTVDSDGQRHSTKVAWRALEILQKELESEEGAPLPRNAWLPGRQHFADAVDRVNASASSDPPPESADGQAIALLPPGSPPNSAGDL